MDFVKTYHVDTYTTLSPARPELSQKGRTVLITGGSSGVGLNISEAYAKAGAARLILVSRRVEQLEAAKKHLQTLRDSDFEVLTYSGDVTVQPRMQEIWHDLKEKNIAVDVLVLNAGAANSLPNGLATEGFVEKLWWMFEINVYSAVVMCDHFLKQGPAKGKAIVSVNSGAAHLAPTRAIQIGYAPSKAALGMLMSTIADNLNPEETQVVSYHPGSILTEATRNSQWANAPIVWNTATLPGEFAVWAASEEARFLHGRFVWCMWDMDELKEKTEEFKHPGFCRIGLQGPKPLSTDELWAQMGDFRKRTVQS